MNDSLLGVLFIPKDKKVSHYIIINNNEDTLEWKI